MRIFEGVGAVSGAFEEVLVNIWQRRKCYILKVKLHNLSIKGQGHKGIKSRRSDSWIAELKVPDRTKCVLRQRYGCLSKGGNKSESQKQILVLPILHCAGREGLSIQER